MGNERERDEMKVEQHYWERITCSKSHTNTWEYVQRCHSAIQNYLISCIRPEEIVRVGGNSSMVDINFALT